MIDPHARRTFLQRAVLGVAVAGVGTAQSAAVSAADGIDPAAGERPALPEDGVFEGELLDVGRSRLVVATGDGERQVALSSRLAVWRGTETGPEVLSPGQDVLVRLDADGVAEQVWSDLDRVSGVVSDRRGDEYEVTLRDGGTRTVRLPSEMMSARLVPARWTVDVVGVRTAGPLRGTTLVAAVPPDRNALPDEPDDAGALDFVYTGNATWFNCPNTVGRCNTCNTSRTNQLAWPALDRCRACSFTCCDCSFRCVRQVHLACGRRFIRVTDRATGRAVGDMRIVDCGPNQNALCSGSCGRRIVDLTRPSFARFRNPTVGCFPCRVRVNT